VVVVGGYHCAGVTWAGGSCRAVGSGDGGCRGEVVMNSKKREKKKKNIPKARDIFASQALPMVLS
jgi:hypothetical protein